jgi:hypothetical protein
MINGYERSAIEELHQMKEQQQEELGLTNATAKVAGWGESGSGSGRRRCVSWQ